MFEVPQRQQLTSVRAPLSLFAPAPSTVSCGPANAELVSCGPFPYSVRVWTGLSEATATRFPGSGQPSAMRFRKRAVPKTGFYGTEYAFGAQKGLLGYATHFQRHSVRKNSLLRYGRDIRCQKQPSLVRDASSKARRTAPATSNASPKARGTAPAAPNAFSEARRTADSTDCGQPPVVRDAFSGAPVHENPLLPHRTHLQCAERPPRGGGQT